MREPSPWWPDNALFALPAEQTRELIQTATKASYEPGEPVLGPGGRGAPGVLLSGRLQIRLTTAGGRSATAGYIDEGQCFGLVGHFRPGLALNLVAESEATVLHFDRAALDRALQRDPAIALAVIEELTARIDDLCRRLRSNALLPVRRRLAAELLSRARRRSTGRMEARVTQQQLADAVSATREHVARLLRELQERGLLRTARGRVEVLDEVGLRGVLRSGGRGPG